VRPTGRRLAAVPAFICDTRLSQMNADATHPGFGVPEEHLSFLRNAG
jgi:hypothetical protein